MFGFHLKIAESGSRLVIMSPADVLMLVLCVTLTVWPLMTVVMQRPLLVRKALLWTAIVIAVYGFLTNCTRLTLDKDTQTARLAQFHWYHWTRQELPLTHIAYAYLATGRGTDQLVLQYENGNTRSLSIHNQMGRNQQRCWRSINFLGIGRDGGSK